MDVLAIAIIKIKSNINQIKYKYFYSHIQAFMVLQNSLYFKRLALLKKCMSNLSNLDDKSLILTGLKVTFTSYSLDFFSQMLLNLCIVRLL